MRSDLPGSHSLYVGAGVHSLVIWDMEDWNPRLRHMSVGAHVLPDLGLSRRRPYRTQRNNGRKYSSYCVICP